ncbi:hypothetical protein FE782_06900 [Paenibacillus antri]|uniref:Uncharacterized protein n=1 Tax=Paenibacillus antri TaxID=2582848 RepID=A0A5R9GG22_9BACL|nr:hypothetical protein [Paenibacillus antri]TLS53090.1 hypothetical protein FE782_06900 [Paenibacillus antri]
MKAFIRIGTAAALAVAISLLISWVGELDGSVLSPSGEPMTVFSDRTTGALTPETVVDALVDLGLTAEIRRVSVRSSLLEIDLALSGEPIDEASIRADMGAVAGLALAKSDNISRVFVRVLEPEREGSGAKLLLALSGAKSEFSATELQRLRDGEPMPDAWLEAKMRLTATDRWRELAP